jgi:hypothetical protein
MITPEVPLSPVESARQNLESAKSSLSTARDDLARASSSLAAIKPEDHVTPASYVKELKGARSAVASAEDAVRFWERRVVAAEQALAPLELAALRDDVASGLVARSLAVDALRTACAQLGPQLDRVREAVALVREANVDIESALEGLRVKGERPERPVDDDLAHLVVHNVDRNLQASSAALSAALAVVKHIESEPQREREKAEAQRHSEQEAKRRYNEECQRGVHGEAEQKRALAEQREWAKHFYGPSAALTSAKGTVAYAELQIARRNAGLKDE